MVHIYNGILLSRKKEQNCTICRDMGGPRDGHTEWSKSEKEKQIYVVLSLGHVVLLPMSESMVQTKHQLLPTRCIAYFFSVLPPTLV